MKYFIALLILAALFAPDANMVDLAQRFAPPSSLHLLGTDELGRDVLLRLLAGGRVSLGIGLTAAAGAALIGALIGIFAGYKGGRVDALLMRATDILIALPLLPLLIVLSAANIGSGAVKIVALIALTGWTGTARLMRARTHEIKKRDFILAARALGTGHAHIVLRHILPNLADTLKIAAALSVGNAILMESALSFLGLGIQPPTPSWGNMLTNAAENIWDHATLALYPGALIFATVLAFNLLGEKRA